MTLAFLSCLGLVALTACGGGTPSANTASTSAATASSTSGPTAGTSIPSAPGLPASGVAPGSGDVVRVIAHTLKADTAGQGTSPMTTPAIDTPTTGSLILVQILTQNTGTFHALVDNKGNTYTQIGGNRIYAYDSSGGNGAGSYLFACLNARGGPGQTWSLVKTSGDYAGNEASLYVVVLQGASSVGAWSYDNTAAYDGTPVATTAANSVVVSFWGPADVSGSQSDPDNTYTQPPGWTLGDMNTRALDQNTGADAWLTVPTAHSQVNALWSSGKSVQSNGSMWLVEVKPRI